MLSCYLLDNIFIRIGSKFYRQIVLFQWVKLVILLLQIGFCCVLRETSYGDQDQVWYLIVSIPDICILPCFNVVSFRKSDNNQAGVVETFNSTARYPDDLTMLNIDIILILNKF